MTGKTHMIAGVAAAVCILRPEDVILTVCTGLFAGVAAALPDMDTATSVARQSTRKLMTFLAGAAVAIVLFCKYAGITFTMGSLARCVIGWLIVAAVGLLGIFCPHRGMTHSLFALGVIAVGLALAGIPSLYFKTALIGYGSHLLLDLLNKEGIQLFFPFKVRVSLKWCRSDGTLNNLIFLVSYGLVFWYGINLIPVSDIKELVDKVKEMKELKGTVAT